MAGTPGERYSTHNFIWPHGCLNYEILTEDEYGLTFIALSILMGGASDLLHPPPHILPITYFYSVLQLLLKCLVSFLNPNSYIGKVVIARK